MNRNALRTAVGAMLAVTVAVGLLANCGAPSSQAPTLPAPTFWPTKTPGVEPTPLATAAPRHSPTATALVTPHPISQATGGQDPTPTPPPIEIDADDTRPPTPEPPEPPPYKGVPAATGNTGVNIYDYQGDHPNNIKITLPPNTPVQVLYSVQRDYDQDGKPEITYMVILYQDTDGVMRKGWINQPAQGPKRIILSNPEASLPPLPTGADLKQLNNETQFSALPAPRPGHQIADGQGRKINLLGEAWTPQEINLLKTRLNWIKANDPVLYAKLFAGFSAIEKGTQNTVLKDVGVCTGAVCAGIANDGSIAMTTPDVTRLLEWGNEQSSNLWFHETIWHEMARRFSHTGDPSYLKFGGIPGNQDKKSNQLAAALGWLAIDKMEKRYGVTSDSIKLKSHQLKSIGLPAGTDLSFLINDPGIQASGILGQ